MIQSAGLAMAGMGFLQQKAQAQKMAYQQQTRGLPPLKIKRITPIMTAPQGARLIVVKVETSEPGLFGLGCATFNQRPLAVIEAIEKYIDPFARDRDVDNIEDMWQIAYNSSYWRNGPVTNCALGGLDMALWDIKGKRAGMPVYQLLGGKCKFAVDTYTHCSANSFEALAEIVNAKIEKGYRHCRIQLGNYGSPQLSGNPPYKDEGFGKPEDGYMASRPYMKATPEMFEHIRKTCGEEVELLHDIHERLEPMDAINMIRNLEPYRPFFIEDPFSPESLDYFPLLRQHTTIPIAMGELFTHPNEWVGLISEKLIDFIRVHISMVGGLTPMEKIATLAEWFDVRTAWHAPPDLSPIGHAANAHLDLSTRNFGIQESIEFNEATREVFPGTPVIKNGFIHINEAPGFGVDINEEVAKKYPFPEHPGYWEPVRRGDGTPIKL